MNVPYRISIQATPAMLAVAIVLALLVNASMDCDLTLSVLVEICSVGGVYIVIDLKKFFKKYKMKHSLLTLVVRYQ